MLPPERPSQVPTTCLGSQNSIRLGYKRGSFFLICAQKEKVLPPLLCGVVTSRENILEMHPTLSQLCFQERGKAGEEDVSRSQLHRKMS